MFKHTFSDLKNRFFISCVIVIISFLLIFYSYVPFLKPIIGLVLIAISLVALWEFAQLALKKHVKLSYCSLATASVIEIFVFFYLILAYLH